MPINEFVGLKAKMYSMLLDDSKESNTAKGVKITTEFNEFKYICLNKKIIRHKMEEFKAKNIKLEHTKSTKNHYHVLIRKRFVINDVIHKLAYFHEYLKKKQDSHE